MDSRCDNVEVRKYINISISIVRMCVCFILYLQDCFDSSDEKNCRTVNFDEEKYLKNKPPPPPQGKDKLPVTAR